MSFALFLIGITLLTVAVRNTQDVFVQLIKGDFTGPGNFFWWIAAIVLIGAIGFVPKLKPVSDAFLVLILLALILTRGSPSFPGGGVFSQFVKALQGTQIGGASTTINFPGVTSL